MPQERETLDLTPVHRLMAAAGLPERANRVYLALIERQRLRAEELAELLAADPRVIHEDLARMSELSLVKQTSQAGVFVATAPDQAVETLIARVQERIAQEQEDIARARERVPQLVESYVQPRVEVANAEIEYVRQPGAVRARLFQLSLEAQESATYMSPGAALSPEHTQASLRLDLGVLARGVRLRTIVSAESLTAAWWVDYLRLIAAEGAAVRVLDAPPLLQIVVDGRIAVVPNSQGPKGPGACILRGPDLCAPSVALFEAAWSSARPLAEVLGTAEEGQLGPKHRQALALLAEGLTDEAVARRMRCSTRTVGRLLAELMRELEASSRFQAGVIAERRGLLPH